MDAMLRHLGCRHDLCDLPGTTSEKLALIRTAGARGLIAWRKTRAQYELTSAGWNALMPRRRFGVAALMMSAATGGMAGALAAGVFWLPADASRPSARGLSSASLSRLEKPNVPRASRSAETSAPASAPLTAITVAQDAVAATAEGETGAVEGLDPHNLSYRPAAESPSAQASLSGGKETGLKKPRHKSAHHRRREQGRTWARADPWQARSIRYAGYGGQRRWFGYR